MWDETCKRQLDTVAKSPKDMAKAADFEVPADRKFLITQSDGIGEAYDHAFCYEKITTLMTMGRLYPWKHGKAGSLTACGRNFRLYC